MKKYVFLLLVSISFFTSCKTPKDIAYLQDLQVGSSVTTQKDGVIRFQPGDKLSIFVHSRDEQMRSLFNLGGGHTMATTSANASASYTVDINGDIDFPVLGLIKIAGKSRTEVERYIKNELQTQNLCKDAVVIVQFYQMYFSVLGNFGGSGSHPITRDKTTILEAISQSGDLGILGKRKNILVLRQEGSQQKPYWIDLTDSKSIYNSPVYYIKQNDIVYVEPNNMAKRSSTVMGSQAFTPSFWMSMFSFLTSAALLIIKL
jgi:polysaccharide export outer membrane protein